MSIAYPHSNQHKKYTVTVLKPSNKGRNAIGTSLHRPGKVPRTRKAKRQSTGGLQPQIAKSRYG